MHVLMDVCCFGRNMRRWKHVQSVGQHALNHMASQMWPLK
jgi:hypothetical protein